MNNFKVGDMVTLVDRIGLMRHNLTIGRSYKVNRVERGFIYVYSDTDIEDFFSPAGFELSKQQIIKQILDVV